MSALTVKNPWAWLIMHAGKDVENRGWETSYRGQLWIHAGKALDAEAEQQRLVLDAIERTRPLARYGPTDRSGYVLGTVDLTDVHHARDCRKDDGTYCSPWAQPGQWHWTLTNPRPLACPFPEQGKQGLWNLQENK